MSQERDIWHLNLLFSLQLQLLQIAEMLPKGEEGQAEGGVNRFFFNLEDENYKWKDIKTKADGGEVWQLLVG